MRLRGDERNNDGAKRTADYGSIDAT
jgi:hypothetical protein